MNVTHSLGEQIGLKYALETYAFHAQAADQAGSGKKYLLLKHEDGSYSVAQKVSGLTYLFQVIASFFGGSGPAYTAKETNKAILGKELSDFVGDTSQLFTLSLAAQDFCKSLSEKLGPGKAGALEREDSGVDMEEISQKQVGAIRGRVTKYKENAREGINSNSPVYTTHTAFEKSLEDNYSPDDTCQLYNILDAMLKEAGY